MDDSDRNMVRSLSREEVADFLIANKPTIQQLARSKLKATPRSIFDSEDVFSSVARRLDELASRGSVRPRSELELWAFIQAVTAGMAVDKMRLLARARALEAEGGRYARLLGARLEECAGDDDAELLTHRMALALTDKQDRQIFYLKMRGANDRSVGILVNVTEAVARKRWYLIRRELEDRFSSGALDD